MILGFGDGDQLLQHFQRGLRRIRMVTAPVDSGPDGTWTESVTGQGSLAGTEFALAESSNILRRLGLSDNASQPESTATHNDLLRLDPELFPFTPFAQGVWILRANLTSYDACGM